MTNTPQQPIRLLDYHCHLLDGCMKKENLLYPFHDPTLSSCCYIDNPNVPCYMNLFQSTDSMHVNISDISDLVLTNSNVICKKNSIELSGIDSYITNVQNIAQPICTNCYDQTSINACLPYSSSYQSLDPLLVHHNVNSNNNNDDLLFLPGTTLGPVINLSSFQLTPTMITLLSKGLNFCPSPNAPDRYELRKDLDKFHVTLRRKLFFGKRLDSTPEDLQSSTLINDISFIDEGPFDYYKFSNPSTWNPKGPHQFESFVTLNEHLLNECQLDPPSQHNLSREEQRALADLTKAQNIIIKPADKGSAVVIQNLDDYISEGLRQLSDTKFYVQTKNDLTHLHNDLISDLI